MKKEFKCKSCGKYLGEMIKGKIRKNSVLLCENCMKSYETYKSLSPQTLAVRMSVKDLEKYYKRSDGFNIGKGTPQNSKASLLYNTLLDYLTLTDKYEKIKSGDKIKIIYVAKNKFGIKYVAFLEELPAEFDMIPDYKLLYLKNVHPMLERIFEAVSWGIIDPTMSYECDIVEFFS